MGRARLSENFLVAPTSAGGHPTMGSGRSVYVYKRGTTTPIDQTLYASDTGSAVLTQPLATDAGGSVMAWATYPEPVDLVVSGAAVPYPTEFVSNDDSLGQISGGTAKFDGKQSLAGSCASGTNIVTVPLGGDFLGFTAADQGKLIVVMQVTKDVNQTPTAETNVLAGTIASVLDATHVTASVNASATLSGTARVLWGSDDTQAIQALLDTVQATTASPAGAEIRLPRGIALASSPIVFTNNHGCRLVGTGAANAANIPYRGTTLVGCHSGSVLQIQGSHLEVVGLGLDGAGRLAAMGIELVGYGGPPAAGLYFSTFRQVRFNACATGLYGQNEQFSNVFHDVTAYLCTNGVTFAPSGTAIQKVTFYNLSTEWCSANGISMMGVENVQFYGGATQQNVNGMLLEKNSLLVLVEGMQFEANHNAAVVISRPDSGFSYGANLARFVGCRFTAGLVGTAHAIVSDGAFSCTWEGCQFDSYPNASVYLFDFTSPIGLPSPSSRFNAIMPNCVYVNNGPSVATFAGQEGVHHGMASAARLTNSANIPIDNDAPLGSKIYPYNNLVWNTVVSDPDHLFDPSTLPQGVTIGRPGAYRFTFSVRLDASAGGTVREISLWQDRAVQIAVASSGPSVPATRPIDLTVSATIRCVGGTVVEAQVRQDSGGPLNVQARSSFSPIFTCEELV